MPPRDEEIEEIGFDEDASLGEEDRVTLSTDRGPRAAVLLAVIDLDGQDYAVLDPEDDGDDGLLVARYHETAPPEARFQALDDLAILDRVREALADLLPDPDTSG